MCRVVAPPIVEVKFNVIVSLLFDVVKRSLSKPSSRTLPVHPPCPVCKAPAFYLDSVDFNKNCEEARVCG